MIGVAYLTDSCLALLENESHLSGRQADMGISAFFGKQLRNGAGRTDELRAFAGFELNIMNQ